MIVMRDQTRTAHDLLTPDPARINIRAMIEALARQCRFAGNVPCGHYSVAQHSVVGAQAALDGNQPRLALLFLLHDAHEAFLGDVITPTARALESLVGPAVTEALRSLKFRWDEAIHTRLGVAFPGHDERRRVNEIDAALYASEELQLRGTDTGHPVLPLRGAIKPQPWAIAAENYTRLLRQLAPHASL